MYEQPKIGHDMPYQWHAISSICMRMINGFSYSGTDCKSSATASCRDVISSGVNFRTVNILTCDQAQQILAEDPSTQELEKLKCEVAGTRQLFRWRFENSASICIGYTMHILEEAAVGNLTWCVTQEATMSLVSFCLWNTQTCITIF